MEPTAEIINNEQRIDEEIHGHFAAIIESSEDAIISKNLNGIVQSWNPAAERIFGYCAQEMIGKPITTLMPAGHENEEPAILARIKRGERIEHYETVRQRKDGSLVDISLTLSPLKNASGEIIGASKIAHDITLRKQTESLLRHFAAIIESSEDAIISLDFDGTIQSWNGGAERTFGYAAHEIIGKSVTTIMPIGRRDEEPGIIERVRRGDRVDHYQTIRQRKDGSIVDISLTVSPIRDTAGNVIGASKIARDITAQKQVEEALRIARERLTNANQDLERRVEDRTASLRQAINQMEEFSYTVSHDLRGPVRAMKGYANAALEDYGDRLDDRGRDYLERIVRGSSRMERLIHDVLTYSRLARSEVEMKPVSLAKLLPELIQPYAELQPPRAEVTVRQPLLPVLAHEPSLAQAISNLLGNAVKFVARGTVARVQVWTEQRADKVRFWVEDNGIGIRPEHQSRLFGMFERVHQDGRFEGTGIGLAIVRKAIEKMGGNLGVQSDGITGTSFWFELSGTPSL